MRTSGIAVRARTRTLTKENRVSYGKVLTVALLGGMFLVGCKEKDKPTPPLRNADGTVNPDAMKQAEGMEKKNDMSHAASTQASEMKNDMSNGMTNMKDGMKNGVDAMKKDMSATTMPSK